MFSYCSKGKIELTSNYGSSQKIYPQRLAGSALRESSPSGNAFTSDRARSKLPDGRLAKYLF